jgi:DNA-binding MarR family transcriptional regulator
MLTGVGERNLQPAGEDRETAVALYALMVTVVRRLPRDMTITQLSTISTLARGGPRRITDLAAIQGIAQPSMTETIASLERAGLVERQRDPLDKRVSLAVLTPVGQDYVRDRRRAGAEAVAQLVAKLPDVERTALAAAVPALVRLRELDDQDREPRRASQPSDVSRAVSGRREPLLKKERQLDGLHRADSGFGRYRQHRSGYRATPARAADRARGASPRVRP